MKPATPATWNHAVTPTFFQFYAIKPKKNSFHDHDNYFLKEKKGLKNIWGEKSSSASVTSWKCCSLNL